MEHYTKSILPIIEANYDKFPSAEKSVADFFIHNRKRMDFSSKAMAERLYVSEASISRFAQRCGYRGYRDFIYQYEDCFFEKEESTVEHAQRPFLSYQELLEKAYNLADMEQVADLVRILNEADKVFVCGEGSSALAAEDMELRFMQAGIDIYSVRDSKHMRMKTDFLGSGSLAIGISISGGTESVLGFLREAAEHNARTVLFTACSKEEYLDYCEEVVLVPSLKHLDCGKIISPQIPVLLMLDILLFYFMEEKQKCSDEAENLDH